MIVLPCRGLRMPIDDPGDCNDSITWPFMVREIAMIVLICRFLYLPIDDPGDCNVRWLAQTGIIGDCKNEISGYLVLNIFCNLPQLYLN